MTERKVLRVQWHDYNNGVYFITICTFQKKHLFGHISKGRIHYTKEGEIVRQCIKAIPFHHRHVELWNYVVMPNHIHFVIAVGAQYFAPTRAVDALRESLQHVMVPATTDNLSNVGCIKPPRHGEACTDNHFNSKVAVIVRSFKAACTIEINRNLRAQKPLTHPDAVIRQYTLSRSIILGGRKILRPYMPGNATCAEEL